MKTFIKTIIGKRFNELTDEAKEKAKRDFLQHCRTTIDFSMDLVDTLKDTYGLQNLTTYYSLSSCQGDGLCLSGEITWSEIFKNEDFRKIALKGLKGGQIVSVKENLQKVNFKHRSRYYYAGSTDIEAEEYSYDITDKQYALIEKVVANIKEWYFPFCKEWENLGYEYFYEVSDEDMQEISEANDYYYTEQGELLDTSDLKEVA